MAQAGNYIKSRSNMHKREGPPGHGGARSLPRLEPLTEELGASVPSSTDQAGKADEVAVTAKRIAPAKRDKTRGDRVCVASRRIRQVGPLLRNGVGKRVDLRRLEAKRYLQRKQRPLQF
jgi:hypothetical protein